MKVFSPFLTVFVPDEVFLTVPPLLRISYKRKKVPERRAFGYFLWVLCFELRLADAVDVADEVEHLVGEAPLVKTSLFFSF